MTETSIGDDPTLQKGQTQTFFREMRKEMYKLKNAVKRKADQSLDRMVKKIDSPFTLVV